MKTSYENAASTKLLATHCALCGRSLRDALSVERGIGPDCAEKHGYMDLPLGNPDWAVVMTVLDGLIPVSAVHPALSPRDACNAIVHHAACAPRASRGAFVDAIKALGFQQLAVALADAAGEVVRLTALDGGRYAVEAPYNPGFTQAIKAARIGARWNPAAKVWEVPGDAQAKVALYRVLRAQYAGLLMVGPKGPVRLQPAA